MVVEIKNLVKRYGDFLAVDNVKSQFSNINMIILTTFKDDEYIKELGKTLTCMLKENKAIFYIKNVQ